MMNTPAKGFTLVETLVAIAILMISIAGPMYSVYQAVQSTYQARDQLIATALAQEGIEYVRNQRDTNYLYNVANPGALVGWLNSLSNCMGQNCIVDPTRNLTPPQSCGIVVCQPLKIDNVNFLYQYSFGTATRFTRTVKIVSVNANEAIVTSTVTWINLSIPFKIVVTEHLYNWL